MRIDPEQKRQNYLSHLAIYADDNALHLELRAFYEKALRYTDSHDLDHTMALINRIENLSAASPEFQYKLLDLCPGMMLFDKNATMTVLRSLKKICGIDDENYEYAGHEKADLAEGLHFYVEILSDKVDETTLIAAEDYEALNGMVDISKHAKEKLLSPEFNDHSALPDDRDRYFLSGDVTVLSRERSKDYFKFCAQDQCLSSFPVFDLEEGYLRVLEKITDNPGVAVYAKPVMTSCDPSKNRIDFIFEEHKSGSPHIHHVAIALPLDQCITVLEDRIRDNLGFIAALREDPSLRGQLHRLVDAEAERKSIEKTRDLFEALTRLHIDDPKTPRA